MVGILTIVDEYPCASQNGYSVIGGSEDGDEEEDIHVMGPHNTVWLECPEDLSKVG